VHGHPTFKNASELSKYDKGMSFVALAVSDDDWRTLCAGELDDQASRQLFAKIEKDTMLRAREIERQLGDKEKPNSKPTVHSLGTRLIAVAAAKKKTDKTFDIMIMFVAKWGQKEQSSKSFWQEEIKLIGRILFMSVLRSLERRL
jgi:hypothetical protein